MKSSLIPIIFKLIVVYGSLLLQNSLNSVNSITVSVEAEKLDSYHINEKIRNKYHDVRMILSHKGFLATGFFH